MSLHLPLVLGDVVNLRHRHHVTPQVSVDRDQNYRKITEKVPQVLSRRKSSDMTETGAWKGYDVQAELTEPQI